MSLRLSTQVLALALLTLPATAQARRISAPLPHTLGGDVIQYEASSSGDRVVFVGDFDTDNVFELYSVGPGTIGSPTRLNVPLAADGDVLEFALSPDGNTVVYLTRPDFSGSRSIHRVPSGGGTSALLGSESRAQDVVFTADGRNALFLADREGAGPYRLFAVPVDGSTPPYALTDLAPTSGQVRSFEISPDGMQVAWIDGLRETFVAPVDGSAMARHLGRSSTVVFEPTGQRLIRRNGFRLFSHQLHGPDAGQEVDLGRFLDGDFTSLSPLVLTPDGRFLILGGSELLAIALDGSQAPVSLDSEPATRVSLTPDGSRAVYLRDGAFQLYSVETSGAGSPVRIDRSGAVSRITIDDDTRVLFSAQVGNDAVVYAAPVDGSSDPIALDAVPGAGVHSLSRSHGSGRVVFYDGSDIRSADLSGSGAFVLTQRVAYLGTVRPRGGALDSFFQVSADGRRVVYQADHRVYGQYSLFFAFTSGARPALELIGESPVGPVLSDVGSFRLTGDGIRAVYTADGEVYGQTELYSALADGSGGGVKLNETLESGDALDRTFETTPDGNVVYLIHRPRTGTRDLEVTAADGSETPIRLATSLVDPSFSVSRDGAHVTFVRDGHVLAVRTDGSGAPIDLSPAGLTAGSHSIEPSSTYAVFKASPFSGAPSDLWATPLDGTGVPKRISGALVAGGNVSSYRFAAGDRVLYLADQEVDERFELWSTSVDGSAAPVRLNGVPVTGGAVRNFTLSPDGRVVAYLADEAVVGQRELFLVPSDGSVAPVKLSGTLDPGGAVDPFVVFSADGSRIAFVATGHDGRPESGLYSVPADGSTGPILLSGRPTSLLWQAGASDAAWQPFPAELTWQPIAPDGKTLVFSSSDGFAAEVSLFAVPIDGSAPERRLASRIILNNPLRFLGGRLLYLDAADRLYQVPLSGLVAPELVSAPTVQFQHRGNIEIRDGSLYGLADQRDRSVVELFRFTLPRIGAQTSDPTHFVQR